MEELFPNKNEFQNSAKDTVMHQQSALVRSSWDLTCLLRKRSRVAVIIKRSQQNYIISKKLRCNAEVTKLDAACKIRQIGTNTVLPATRLTILT